MSIQEVRQLLGRYEWSSGRGVSREEIAEAQTALGPLPDDYQEFLGEFGWLEFGPFEIYGLGLGRPDHLDVIRMTTLERSEPAKPLPATWVCVMNDGAGNLVSFNTTCVTPDQKTCPVILWDHEIGEGDASEEIAPSFEEWLIGILRAEI